MRAVYVALVLKMGLAFSNSNRQGSATSPRVGSTGYLTWPGPSNLAVISPNYQP